LDTRSVVGREQSAIEKHQRSKALITCGEAYTFDAAWRLGA
jgi:hypothetical protein